MGAPHPEVAWALAYALPADECQRPNVRRGNDNATRAEKFRRQAKRYTGCVKTYQEARLIDFNRIKDAAVHGLTTAQAQALRSHLQAIASRIKELGEDIELVMMTDADNERLANQGARTSGAQYP